MANYDKNDFYYMRLALELARRAADEDEVPVGALLVADGQIVGQGYNRREGGRDATLHAEMIAIREACATMGGWRLPRSTMYVTLEPCPMCAGALVMAGLGMCYFAARDERQGCVESVYALPQDPAFYHRVPCVGGLLEEEAQALLKRFFQSRRAGAEPLHPTPDGIGCVSKPHAGGVK